MNESELASWRLAYEDEIAAVVRRAEAALVERLVEEGASCYVYEPGEVHQAWFPDWLREHYRYVQHAATGDGGAGEDSHE